MVDPLVVTALLDDRSQARFDALRQEHFPPSRNHVAAHLTLFHALPGEQVVAVEQALRDSVVSSYDGVVAGVRSLGRGVAYDVHCPELVSLHAGLRRRFAGWLTAQDTQGLRPHVTVANKVPPTVARSLLESLSSSFAPWPVTVRGLGLWWYRGGPWELVAEVVP
ncbi:MAG: 2'-5' RNA ligase family protein [Mycobacteriales bacterium]|nr:2'-5' RNA ligase family protein [Mycobacteriales bacterium]